MKAVTSAGKKRYAARAGFGLALASSLSPVMAAASVDQTEQLMREQQALQNSQSLQLQSLRQQLDSQALENQTRDWQLAGGLMSALLIALMGAWLLSRWPKWQQQWQQARSKKNVLRVSQPDKHSLPQEQLDAAFVASGLQSGEEIDHSGEGVVKRLVQQKKRRQRLSEPTPDSEWLAQLDELDSQFLADDALREYELRKTVGLISSQDEQTQRASIQQKHAAGVDDVWNSLEEVPLEQVVDSSVAQSEHAQPHAVQVDVSQEVQRVRKLLHERRKKRNLQTVATTDNAQQEADESLDFELPVSEPIEQIEPAVEVMTEPPEELALSYVQEHEAEDPYSPSVRAMSDAETRLALAQEFEKLGQMDEAAQLCEEVLACGSPEEQSKAKRFLKRMPGR